MKYDTVKELNKRKGCVEIKKIIQNHLGSETTEQIWQKAIRKLNRMHQKYPDIPKGQESHVSTIFPTVALYLALKETAPEQAMQWMEEGAKINVLRQSGIFKAMVKFPFGKSFLLKGFANMGQKMFGESAGFENHLIQSTKDICQFDILKCPYVKYCAELGCPELAHIFCNNDIYAYGSLDGIQFLRTQTLGTGGEKCDFLLKRIR